MPKFKIGDKVRAKDSAPYGITTDGWTGEVVKVYDDENICVFGAGACGSKERRNGFGVESKYFDLVEEQKVVITTDGRVTKAAMYEGKQRIKVATSTCHPNDEFDFAKGAAIALERLTDQECDKSEKKLKYFTGKVRCIRLDERNAGWLTKGKIYTFVDGCSVDDVGDRLPLTGPMTSIEDLNERIYSDFEEVKSFDWDGFKAGKFNVIVNRENIGIFLGACETHDINWPRNKATEWNPIERMDAEPNFIMLMLKAALNFESTDKCDLKVEDGNLKYSFSLNMRDETVIYG